MSQINAKGKLDRVEVNVQVILEDGLPIIEVEGEFDESVQKRFNELLKSAPSMGGTFYPQSNTLLAAFSVLESTFFDEGVPVVMESVGDIGEVPTYDIEGIVY